MSDDTKTNAKKQEKKKKPSDYKGYGTLVAFTNKEDKK